MDLKPGRPLDLRECVQLLDEARVRTLFLIGPLPEADLAVQHSSLMSPIVWDLGHIAHFEEVWLLEKTGTGPDGSEGLRGIYNPFDNPRASRDRLELPSVAEALEYMGRVRREVLARKDRLGPRDDDPLLKDGFVFRLVLQHEYQHDETILQTLQLKKGEPYPAPRALALPEPDAGWADRIGSMVRFPGGMVEIGSDDRSTVYDNERPRHSTEVEPFSIDAAPVTNGQYLEFMDAGGYSNPKLWSAEGWKWLQKSDVESPGYWRRRDGRWEVRSFDRWEDVDPIRPVCHVTYHEAEAFARFAGKRLPTEVEWEAAATWDPEQGEKRAYPWGEEPPDPTRANVDMMAFGTAPVGSFPGNVSPVGCYGMIGDVWEWTASDFQGYPGFESFPYPEYSQVFFGTEYKVLRGGSWASRPGAVRGTFRNWDFPVRRQIFSGFRCALGGGA